MKFIWKNYTENLYFPAHIWSVLNIMWNKDNKLLIQLIDFENSKYSKNVGWNLIFILLLLFIVVIYTWTLQLYFNMVFQPGMWSRPKSGSGSGSHFAGSGAGSQLLAPGSWSRLLAPSSGSWLRLPNLLFHFILTSLPNLTDNLKLDRIIVSLYFLDLETQSNLYNLSFFIEKSINFKND